MRWNVRLAIRCLTMWRLRYVATLALLAAIWATGAAAEYPERPVTIIVPFAAGGGGDIITRLVANQMSQDTGKSFIVENRGGAGGRIGTAAGIKAAPDGYTVLFLDRAYVMMRALYGSTLPWDADSEPTPVTLLTRAPFLIVVSPKLNVKSLRDLITFARANPRRLNYGSSGVGSTNHVMGELLAREAHVELTHVPYKSMCEAIGGILSGSIDLVIVSAAPIMPLLRDHRVVPLAVASKERLAALPDVPTVIEAGLPGYIADNWFALAVPKGTPGDVVRWLWREVARAVDTPAIRQRLAKEGSEASAVPPEEAARILREDTQRLSEVIRTAGIKGE